MNTQTGLLSESSQTVKRAPRVMNCCPNCLSTRITRRKTLHNYICTQCGHTFKRPAQMNRASNAGKKPKFLKVSPSPSSPQGGVSA